MAIGTILAQLIRGRKWYKRPISKQAKHNIVEATEDRYIAEGKLSPRPESKEQTEEKKNETQRTSDISNQLRNSGLTEDEIERLKGKKKTMLTGKR